MLKLSTNEKKKKKECKTYNNSQNLRVKKSVYTNRKYVNYNFSTTAVITYYKMRRRYYNETQLFVHGRPVTRRSVFSNAPRPMNVKWLLSNALVDERSRW